MKIGEEILEGRSALFPARIYLANLLDLRNRSADGLHAVASDHHLVLFFCALNSDALLHNNLPNHFLAEIVSDLHQIADLGPRRLVTVDVDREMCIHELHLVLVTLGNSNHHIADVTANRANSGQLLLGSKPLLNLMQTSRLFPGRIEQNTHCYNKAPESLPCP